MPTDEHTILGEIAYVHSGHEESNPPAFCRVKPIYRELHEEWVAVGPEVSDSYPSAGLVFWPHPPSEVAQGRLFKLRISSRLGELTRRQPDRYSVDHHDVVAVFVDLRGEVSSNNVRRLCASGRFTFATFPPGPILIRHPSGESQWIGPMHPSFSELDNGRVHGAHEISSGFIEVRDVTDDQLQDIRAGDHHWLVLKPARSIGGSVGFFNSQEDAQLLNALPRRIRKWDKDAAEALDITQGVYVEYLSALKKAHLIGDDSIREAAREVAIRELFGELSEQHEADQELVAALVEHPSLKHSLDDGVAAAVAARADEIRTQAELLEPAAIARTRDMESSLANLNAKVETKRAEQERLDAEISKRREELETSVERTRTAIQKVARATLDDAADALAPSLLVDALIGKASPQEMGKASSQRIESEVTRNGRQLEGISELRGIAMIAASNAGLPNDLVLSAVSCILAKIPTFIGGTKSRILAQTAANILTGGVTSSGSIPSDVYSISDVFSLPLLLANETAHTPISFRDFLHETAQLDSISATVLIGINRPPPDVAVAEIVESFASGTQRAFSYSPRQRPSAEYEVARVHSNARIIGTLEDGESSFSLGRSLGRYAALIDSERRGTAGDASASPELTFFAIDEDVAKWIPVIDADAESVARAFATRLSTTVTAASCEREIAIFSSVFGDTHKGIAEWALARCGAYASLDQLTDLLGTSREATESLFPEVDLKAALSRLAKWAGDTG